MKRKRNYGKLLVLLLIILMVFSLIGCTKDDSEVQNSGDTQKSDDTQEDEDDSETPKDNVKSDGYEKFSQLKIGMTESEVNAILGEPTSVDKAYYYYNIIVNGQDLELNVWINLPTGLVTNIYGDFSNDKYRGEFIDSKTDLSAVNDLDSGKISNYDECVAAFKTEGNLISIDDDGIKTYLWVNSDDGYLRVTFEADGSVKDFSGYC